MLLLYVNNWRSWLTRRLLMNFQVCTLWSIPFQYKSLWVSMATINEYWVQIEAVAAKLAILESNTEASEGSSIEAPVDNSPIMIADSSHSLEGLRRRIVPPSMTEDKSHDTIEDDQSTPVKLDDAARTHIRKHRKLQENLTNEMVGLARELKEGVS